MADRAGGEARPTFEWTAAVWLTGDGGAERTGTAFLVSPRLLVTCAHVAHDGGLHVTFPKAAHWDRAFAVRSVERHVEADLALIELERDAPVRPVTIRSERTEAEDDTWLTFGYPRNEHQPDGHHASGRFGEEIARGRVILRTDDRSKAVVVGFSGSPVWAPRTGAVVAVIAEVGTSDVKAISIRELVRRFPASPLRRLAEGTVVGADEIARAAWSRDPNAWDAVGRGVSHPGERGFRFRGRRAALDRINAWLTDSSDRHVLVVTGSPGAGKSALLGRVVTTADPVLRGRLPRTDPAALAPEGTVSVAVNAKGQGPHEVANAIAAAGHVTPPQRHNDLGHKIANELRVRPRVFTVVVDALDEAEDAQGLVNELLLPLSESVPDAPIRVMIGTRRYGDGGDLLAAFGAAGEVVDLDTDEYFRFDDLVEFCVATLRLEGAERPGNPYVDAPGAVAVARRIAEAANRNFLVAGLLARTRGLYDVKLPDPDAVLSGSGRTSLDKALFGYVRNLPDVDGVPPEEVLTVLAYARAPGWSLEMWRQGLRSIFGRDVRTSSLGAFAGGSAANFLVQISADGTTYRLFHQALNDTLLRSR